MNLAKTKLLNRFKWPVLAVATVILLVVLLAVFTDTFETSKSATVLQLTLLVILLLFISAIVLLVKIFKISAHLGVNNAKFEKIADIMEKNR